MPFSFYFFSITFSFIFQFKLSIGKLKKEREDILNAIWKQIANVLRVHVENVDKKRAHMAELKRLDAESAAEILKSQERINQEEVISFFESKTFD